VADREALAWFSCFRFDQPWTRELEDEIRERLLDRVIDGLEVVGLWAGGELCGVAAWRIHGSTDPVLCRGDIVAVDNARRRKTYGRRLKLEMMMAATRAGAAAISSRVHRDNVAMRSLNEQLEGVEEDDEEDPNYVLCVIPLGVSERL